MPNSIVQRCLRKATNLCEEWWRLASLPTFWRHCCNIVDKEIETMESTGGPLAVSPQLSLTCGAKCQPISTEPHQLTCQPSQPPALWALVCLNTVPILDPDRSQLTRHQARRTGGSRHRQLPKSTNASAMAYLCLSRRPPVSRKAASAT